MDQLAGIITRLFDCAKVHAAYVYELEDNIASLKVKWEQLENMYKDMKQRIEYDETGRDMRKTEEVNGWLQQVQNLEKEIRNIPETHDKCLSGCCPMNCMSSYKLGKQVSKMLEEVGELVTSGKNFDKNVDITYRPAFKQVNEMPSIETVGLDLMLNKVWKSLEDKNVGTIGLYGMGGAGKTTLMKEINNIFGKRKHDFAVVLWVVVSRDHDINKIMDDIRNRLGVTDDIWNRSNQDDKVAKIYQVLKQKKFVLMIDDLWGKLELAEVGVPLPKESNNQSKVLFTTRSEDVCAKMQAQEKFKVECLSEEEAFDLFRKKIGEETLKCHGEILKLAREMANECKGLPLALITVGSAMAGVNNIEAWRQAKKDLRSSPWIASDLEKKVFHILKFSYDRLPDETHKICFLYCALYPEDYEVEVDGLIDRWIGEGFLGSDHKSNNIYDMYEEGESIIAKLKLSCMLESVKYEFSSNPPIKMHDMIRDMALWLARDEDRNKDKIIVEGEALSMSQMSSERLNVVERISIINHGEGIFKVPACPKLITLCVNGNSMTVDFSHLQSTARLKVLDLSGYNGSYVLDHLPVEIGKLINLEFLNLWNRRFKSSLPIEFKNLKNLRVLLMEYVVCHVDSIFLDVIESLERLKVFRFHSWVTGEGTNDSMEVALLERLESLPELEELCFTLQTLTGMQKLVNSTKLRDCSRHVGLRGIYEPLEMTPLLASLSRMKQLGHLGLFSLPNIMEGSSITDSCHHLRKLRWLEIYHCDSITHLTCLKFAPLIELLDVRGCKLIEEVVKGTEDEAGETNIENANDIFSNLRFLYMEKLPKLKSIHERVLDFPSLKYIEIYDCPNLRKLPLNSNSAKDLIQIGIGNDIWWNNLQWEDATVKDRLQTKLRFF